MKFKIFMLVVFCAFLCSRAHAQAGCTGYYETEYACSGTGGCTGTYVSSYCSFGCISGDCFNHSGSGLCCNHLYYTASIRENGGTCGGDCGLARVHHGKPLASTIRRDPKIQPKAFPEVASGTVALVPDRCRGIYAIVEIGGDESAHTQAQRGIATGGN